jgi:hypothetical protein
MTLILSCATPDYVFQVSDRRLTAMTGDAFDDENNKAVVIGGRLAFGYTGHSQVHGMKTDDWLVATARSVPTQNLRLVCEHIRDGASAHFARIRPRWVRTFGHAGALRHAFVAVGWAQYPGADRLEPLYVTVSNALDDHGDWRDEPERDFSIMDNPWGAMSGGFFIQSAGQTLAPEEKRAIWRHVRRCAKHSAAPGAFQRALIDAALFVATRREKRPGHGPIGRSLLAICIPRVAAEEMTRSRVYRAIYGWPTPLVTTFLYVPLSGQTVEVCGPSFAGDGTAVTGFRAGPL